MITLLHLESPVSLGKFLVLNRFKFTAHYAVTVFHVLCCRSLFSSYQQGADDEGQAQGRSTGHNVRRFTGTAMLMTNQLPEESLQAADSHEQLTNTTTSTE